MPKSRFASSSPSTRECRSKGAYMAAVRVSKRSGQRFPGRLAVNEREGGTQCGNATMVEAASGGVLQSSMQCIAVALSLCWWWLAWGMGATRAVCRSQPLFQTGLGRGWSRSSQDTGWCGGGTGILGGAETEDGVGQTGDIVVYYDMDTFGPVCRHGLCKAGSVMPPGLVGIVPQWGEGLPIPSRLDRGGGGGLGRCSPALCWEGT